MDALLLVVILVAGTLFATFLMMERGGRLAALSFIPGLMGTFIVIVFLVPHFVGQWVDDARPAPQIAPATLSGAVSVLDQAPSGSRVILIPGQRPLVAVDDEAPAPAEKTTVFDKSQIVSIATSLELDSSTAKSACVAREETEICLQAVASEPVLTLSRVQSS